MKYIVSMAVVSLLVLFFFSADLASKVERTSTKKMIVAAFFAVCGVLFTGCSVYLMKINPSIHPLLIAVLVVSTILMGTGFIFSLAFVATIPEDLEREAANEQ